jgi:uncharacterized protein (TIGR03000 family)
MFRTRLLAMRALAYGIAVLLPFGTAIAAARSGGGSGHGSGGGHSGGGHAMGHGHSSGFHSGGFHSGHGNKFGRNKFGRGFRNRGFFPFSAFGDGFLYPGWDYDAYDWPSYGYSGPTITNVQDYAYGYATSNAADSARRHSPMPRPADVSSARLSIAAPKDAEVWVEGTKLDAGHAIREFSTPALEPGRQYTYTIRAKWVGADGQTVTQAQDITFSAGSGVIVRFPLPA